MDVSATTSGTTTATGSSGAKLTADFNMFLRLLTTQLQYQDPLDPMDTSEYTQQLVSYSQVEQAIQQTQTLESILGRLGAQDLSAATGYIGRSVDALQPVATLDGDGASWFYELDANAAETRLGIYNSRGTRVAELAGETGRGRHLLAWDGGGLPPGNYELRVEAATATGTRIGSRVGVTGIVDSVEASGGDVLLNLGGTRIRSTDIASVAAE